jgi:hypothetical protein
MNGYHLEDGGRKSLHAKRSGGLYFFKDSNRFYHHATEKHGGPIDFIMQFENMGFVQAVGHLIGAQPEIGSHLPPPSPPVKEKGQMALPEKADNVRRVYWYLCTARGIDPEIVSKLIKEKKIYQQAGRGNCVFVGFDENKVPLYCSKRGTSPERPYKADQDCSDKGYPFPMEGTSSRLYATESPIDAMSRAALCKMRGIDHEKDHRISLGCLSDRALEWYLKQHPKIKRVIFALDNDAGGNGPDGSPCNHGQEAAAKFAAKYGRLGFDTAVQTPAAKDFNEDLMNIRRAHTLEQTAEQEAGEGELLP